MRYFAAGVLAVTALGGCVVHTRDHHHAPPPPPRTTVQVTYGWSHHRYAVWTEYYGCSDDEVYYLENCGYDDDDILVCLMVARRARVPLRHVFFEYDRCGRSHYALSLSYRLPRDIWFCNEVPRGYACPPYYARSYGYYWRGESHYYSNDEIYGLIHLQIGFRYYGHSHTTYFREYEAHRGGGDRMAFRAIVVKDPHAAGRGGKKWDEAKVVVRPDRPFNAPDPREWERKQQVRREEIKVRVTPQREREEQEQARQAVEQRKDSREQAKREAEQARQRRQDQDKKEDAEERTRPKPVGRPEKPDAEAPLPNRRPEIPRREDSPPREEAPKREAPPRIEEPRRQPAPPPRREAPPKEEPKREPPPPREEPRREPPKREPPPREEPKREPPKREPPPREEPKREPPPKREEAPKREGPQKKDDDRKRQAPR